jgi:hypothetical protein
VVAATICGLAVSLVLGYLHQLSLPLVALSIIEHPWPDISFAWILPASFAATIVLAQLLAFVDPSPAQNLAGLTWWTRDTARSTASDTGPTKSLDTGGRSCETPPPSEQRFMPR